LAALKQRFACGLSLGDALVIGHLDDGFGLFAVKGHSPTPALLSKVIPNGAVHQGEAARAVPTCRHLVDETPQRWSLDYDQHYAYCMRIYGSGAGMEEDRTRAHELRHCEGRG
jgi:hypothetical protein